MTKPSVPFLLRDRIAEDIPLVTDAWLRSYRGARAVAGVPTEVYRHHEGGLIQRLWRDPEVTWLIAAPPNAGSFAYGFLCGEATDAGPVVHYMYVKHVDRGFGVAGAMLDAFLVGQPRNRAFYTHSTPDGEELLRRSTRFRREDWIYDPYLAWDAPWRA